MRVSVFSPGKDRAISRMSTGGTGDHQTLCVTA